MFLAWLLFSVVDLRIMKGTGLSVQAGALFFSHLNCWNSSPMRPSPPHRSEGTDTATEGSDATFIAKASHSSPVFAAHAQTTASLGGHHHLVELPDLQMRTLKNSKKPEWWKITEEQCLVCSAWAITHSSSSDVLQEIKEPDSILFCLTESQYCLRSAGAKADFSTPF